MEGASKFSAEVRLEVSVELRTYAASSTLVLDFIVSQ